MNRKPIFDAVRTMLGRGFTRAEVDALDRACDLAEAVIDPPAPRPQKCPATLPVTVVRHGLGSLSEEFESGGRGPGAVSGGRDDPGGVSYGVYQLSSRTGSAAAFVRAEGKAWAADFADKTAGSAEFSGAWKAVAARDPAGFRTAQHAFIERTHYRPVVRAVADRKGFDLDLRADAVRDATWSCAVQHAGAPNILIAAIDATDPVLSRSDPGYDRKLLEAIYKARIDYVLHVAGNPKLKPGERDQLVSITRNRYPAELAKALQMLDARPPASPVAAPLSPVAAGSIDGNAVAAANGIDVKSAAVRISSLHPAMEAAIVAVAEVSRTMGLPRPVITSGNDGRHMTGSLHYRDRALDFRGRNLKIPVGRQLAAAVAQRLGKGYDVAFETFVDPNNNHLHVEYDPD